MIIGTSRKRSKAFVQKSSVIEEKPKTIAAPRKNKKSKGIGCPNCEKGGIE